MPNYFRRPASAAPPQATCGTDSTRQKAKTNVGCGRSRSEQGRHGTSPRLPCVFDPRSAEGDINANAVVAGKKVQKHTLKRSDYCKNPMRKGSDGQKRRKQSSFKGYCRSCGPHFVPEVVPAVKEKMQVFCQKRAESFPCHACGFVHYYKKDPDTGLHYCKLCWPKKNVANKCEYCCIDLGVMSMACSFKESCRHFASVCDTCAGLWDRPVCGICYQQEFAGRCFRCKGAIAYTSPQSSSHKLRYCDACYIYTFADVAEGDDAQKCYYCHTISETVATTKCSYFVECPGHVRVCSWCVQVRQSVACSACYLRNWKHSCYSCNKASQRGEWGKYCKACFQLVTETGRRQVLAEESTAYFRKLAIPVEITGDEPWTSVAGFLSPFGL